MSLPRHTLAQPEFAATPGASPALFSPSLFAPGHRAKPTVNPAWILEHRDTPAQSFSQAVLTLNTVQAPFSPALLPQRDSHSNTCSAMAPPWMPPAAANDSAGVQQLDTSAFFYKPQYDCVWPRTTCVERGENRHNTN